jgi:hypothetical protein
VGSTFGVDRPPRPRHDGRGSDRSDCRRPDRPERRVRIASPAGRSRRSASSASASWPSRPPSRGASLGAAAVGRRLPRSSGRPRRRPAPSNDSRAGVRRRPRRRRPAGRDRQAATPPGRPRVRTVPLRSRLVPAVRRPRGPSSRGVLSPAHCLRQRKTPSEASGARDRSSLCVRGSLGSPLASHEGRYASFTAPRCPARESGRPAPSLESGRWPRTVRR